MQGWETLSSAQDASVNHVFRTKDGGAWETRYVQRSEDYCICYLSSHTGCAQSCRFCHLTATGQTMMQPATIEDYMAQAEQTAGTYLIRRGQGLPAAERIHFNFMARGEALANPHFLENSKTLFGNLDGLAGRLGLEAAYLVSSILPREFDQELAWVLDHPAATLYYSLYSVNPRFRKRWLPKAMEAGRALDLIADYQKQTAKPVVLHWAFIEGENDSDEDVDETLRAICDRGIQARFNLVRYNPHDKRHGKEPGEARLGALLTRISSALQAPESRIVPRVGFDVKASCGMFVE